MIETLLGTLFGGAFRLAPEVFKFFDRKDERAHELAMLDRQIEADQLKAEHGETLAHIEADRAIGVAELGGLIEATKAQAVQTGIRWVDAFNALIRPLLALQWLILLWPACILAGFALAVQSGTDPLLALKAAFGVDEKAMAASVASFWLVDRSLRKMRGR